MRFIVALLIASLFVDKADSELSFIPGHNLYPCASFSPGVRSQKYSHPYPLTSIPRASYPFSFDHDGGVSSNRKTRIGFRDNQARTDDFHHVKVTLYRWVIPLTCSHQEIELTNPKTKGRETQRHYSTILEQLGDGPSFLTITDTKIMDKMGFNSQLLLSEIGLNTDSSHSTRFHNIKPYDFPDLNQAGFPWRRFGSACSIWYGLKKEIRTKSRWYWSTPSSCAKDLTIPEGTGVPSFFHFHSRILMCFRAPLRLRKMDKFPFFS